ncbi:MULTISPECIES: hypothetical protein [Photorhabdus]|uniref:Uncharacterized protein n=2 Tax=Photorhabdus TaxID=29487 RepID=A0AAW6BMI1_9GAMM|nr:MULTISPECIES: hypothetical protein [Photorhabdus]EYU16580.1 hypothetical protein BA1DRAFT_00864 [Photorhabdus aegyptia]MDB6373878.1 hypothetical protein [Photorhabdus bodei]
MNIHHLINNTCIVKLSHVELCYQAVQNYQQRGRGRFYRDSRLWQVNQHKFLLEFLVHIKANFIRNKLINCESGAMNFN